ncbi:MAG: hypothetical protein IPI79_00985 [Moraxellaceae bacterium]|nr:hypothetical protein [Moraxellaceae bacterium]
MKNLFNTQDLNIAKALGEVGFTNPFGVERIALETQILGEEYIPAFHIWIITPTHQGFSPNLAKLAQRAEELLQKAQQCLQTGYTPNTQEWEIYGELALYALYYRYESAFYQVVTEDI